jgi:AraC-like DNA-binding protein
MTAFARPLDRFPVVRTQNVEEMRAALTRVYARPQLRARITKVDATLNYLKLRHVGLGYTKYGIDLSGAYPESDTYLQAFPLGGRGEVAIKKFTSPLSPGHGLTVSPGRRFAAKADANYEHLFIVVSMRGLTDKLGTIIGRPIGRAVEFDPIMNNANPAAKALRDHLGFLVKTVSESDMPLPKLVLEEFEQTLLVMILQANRHNYSGLLDRVSLDVASWQVRRAEDYIEANWRRPITLTDLVRVTGASALDLFRSFKKSRGYSPMEYADRVRLGHARELLHHPDTETTVASVAMACGFANLGRFETDYFLAFGESPSTALRRGKDDVPV